MRELNLLPPDRRRHLRQRRTGKYLWVAGAVLVGALVMILVVFWLMGGSF